MAIQPIALAVDNPDVAGKVFAGFEQGRKTASENAAAQYGYAASQGDKNAMAALYAGNPQAGMAIQQDNRLQGRYDDTQHIAGLQAMAKASSDILAMPRDQQPAAWEQMKALYGPMYGYSPDQLAHLGVDQLPRLASLFQTEAERLQGQLGLANSQAELTGRTLANQNAAAQYQYWNGGAAPSAPASPGLGPQSYNVPNVPSEYQPLIQNAAARYGLDPAMFARQIAAESNFDPNAVSPKGAMGLGQVMPATARDPGYGIAPLTNPYDPAANLDFSAHYMRAMIDKNGGDPAKALASYNAGLGTVQKGGPLPAETRGYVSGILGAGAGVGVQNAAIPDQIQVQGQRLDQPAPAQPAPAQPQSVADLAMNDPTYLRLMSEQARAAHFQDQGKAATYGELMKSRLAELQSQLPAVLAPKDRLKADQQAQKAKAADQAAYQQATSVLGTIDDALKSASEPNDFRTGAVGSLVGAIPGTGAYKLDSKLDTIRANVAFNALQQMRQNSPTGGALGSISDADMRLLSSEIASLKIGLGDNELRANLQKVRDHFAAIADKLNPASPNYAAGSSSDTGGDVPEVGSVIDGYRFTGGNPADQSSWQAVE